MTKPFFSIVIPAYNASRTLSRCLDRLFDSDFRNFEVIVIDDKSSDNTIEIAKHFPCRVITLEKNIGEGGARNAGAGASGGTYLFFLDSDIYLRPDTLLLIYECIQKGGYDCVSTIYDTQSFYPDVWSTFKHLYDARYMLSLSGSGNQFCCSAVAVRKKAFKQVGGFNPMARCNADRDLSFRMHDLGYRIYYEEKARVSHDKPYTLRSMLRLSQNRGFHSCKVYQGLEQKKGKLSGAQPGYLAGIILIPAIVVSSFFSRIIAGILLILFYLAHYRFLKFIRQHVSFKMFLESLPVLFLDNIAIAIGVWRAAWSRVTDAFPKR